MNLVPIQLHEATNLQIDWLIAQIERKDIVPLKPGKFQYSIFQASDGQPYRPSDKEEHCVYIIKKHGVSIVAPGNKTLRRLFKIPKGEWATHIDQDHFQSHKDFMVAAMRTVILKESRELVQFVPETLVRDTKHV